jgi:hypothetical protein
MFSPNFTCDAPLEYHNSMGNTDTPESEGWLLVIVNPLKTSATVKKWRTDLALSKNASVRHVCSTDCLKALLDQEFSAVVEVQPPAPKPQAAIPKAATDDVSDDGVPF